jgi:hypothetical protein
MYSFDLKMPTLISSTLQSSCLRLQRAFTPTQERKRNKKRGTTKPIRNALRDTAHSQNVVLKLKKNS